MSDTAAQDLGDNGRDVDILGVFEHLKDALFRYYNTPFGLADEHLERERQDLFDTDGGAWRRPLLEIRPRYVEMEMNIAESVEAAGAHPELAALVELGLLRGVDSLYEHQHQALAAAVRDGRDVVVTAGTGSGKTESFMLPILADLVRESASWPAAALPSNRWWASPDGSYQPQRWGESARHAAVRALVLYPMNALVDDQMMRLRKALDSDGVRNWLARARPGHRFYFGRYTGATPVPGDVGSLAGERTLRNEFNATEERSLQAQKAAGDGRYFIPRLDGAEMRCRWDMIQAPPDIMITNYSMLNVMLMRSRESGIFDMTRRWLEEVPDARFTLVVDELHTYRGTAGTEISYLLRNLRHRLGLDGRPEKFRILAASASLEAPRDLDFLQEFFGVGQDRFEVLGGRLVLPAHNRTDISGHADAFAELAADPGPGEADRILAETGACDAFVNALRDGDRLVADFDNAVAARLFPGADEDTQGMALRGVLASLRRSTDPRTPKLRGHLFFRNIPGVWACSDSACPDAPRPEGIERTVGKLYSRPTPRCSCGARVLELLYCQNCGDVFLGGYAPESAFRNAKGRPFQAGLLADLPDLDSLPDSGALGSSAANYIVYWPRRNDPAVERQEWDSSSDKGTLNASFAFKRSVYDPRTGILRNHRDHTGWSFHTSTPQPKNRKSRLRAEDLPAAPTQCPNCGDDWELKRVGTEALSLADPRRMRTPVRSMRTGFEKVNQVLTTGVLSLLPNRQAVVFSDSRQDAAKLSSGLGLRHYQDLLRLLLAEAVGIQGDPVADLAAVSAFYRSSTDGPVDREALKAAAKTARARLHARDPQAYDAWEKTLKPSSSLDDLDSDVPDPVEAGALYNCLSRAPSLDSHGAAVAKQLVQLGINPGGPKASLQQTAAQKDADPQPWTDLYHWPETFGGHVRDKSSLAMSTRQEQLHQEIGEALASELLNGLFGSAGRDFESLGLGWLALADDQAPLEAEHASDAALARASLRVLGHMRRFAGLRSPADEPPKKLREFWASAADHLGQDRDELRSTVERIWGDAVKKYIIQLEHVALRQGRAVSWTCYVCRRRHMHPGVGICTKCRRPLPNAPEAFEGTDADYYAWMARNQLGRFRLNTAELTGQTDRLDAQARQARFQGIFLDGAEHELPDTLDVLSVTTTMEAGVDIGPLSAVLMANMPPTRFNYQQRVGRAGRRSSPVALALTVCRGRSHDEHYFQDPKRITNDPTPQPYLSTDMKDIYQRVLAAEVLRRAFSAVQEATGDDTGDPTRNVHGQFGFTADWPTVSETISLWIKAHGIEILRVAEALADRTRGTWSPTEAAAWVTQELTDQISRVANEPRGHRDLSQRLAEAGLLPMFGFPTSVRYLYTRRPAASYPWPPRGTVDRSLDIAISQFAPGAETVKDGRVHTATGVVAYEPFGRFTRAVESPLGQPVRIGVCRACGHLAENVPATPPQEDAPAQLCPACGAADDSYREINLCEPAGFYSGGKARDFDGNFAWKARSLAPRTAADLATGAPQKIATPDMVVHAGKGERYSVNDNGGRLFRFAKVKPTARWSGGYLETGATDLYPWLANDLATDEEPLSVAIGATQRTDLFLLGPRAGEIPALGLRLNLTSVPQITGFPDDRSGRRAAWYSLAALLRVAAGSLLQVQPNEIASGIHGAGSGTSKARTFAFLSDTLDNGAGYCTHLAEPDVFEQLMQAAAAMLGSFAEGMHGCDCRGSCYQCLRDYTNTAYHSLLDWRLAGELLGILRGDGAAGGARADTAAGLLRNWASDFQPGDAEFVEDLGGTGPAVLFEQRVWVAAKGPFEAADASLEAPRIRAVRAAAAAEGRVPDVVFADAFLLDRAPARVTAVLADFDGR